MLHLYQRSVYLTLRLKFNKGIDMQKKIILRIQLLALMMISFPAAAAVVGDSFSGTTAGAECVASGLGFDITGTSGTGTGPVFFLYTCTDEEEDTAKLSSQLTRRTNLAIKNHLYNEMMSHFTEINVANGENKAAASSDSNKMMPDDFWGESSITQISDEQGTHTDTDIYQFVGGIDKSMGDFIFGAALTYAHTEDEQGKTHFTADTVGITPYAAYKITDYLFASTLLGYNYTHTNAVGGLSDVDSDDFISETNLNFFKVVNSFIIKGRAGIRYKYTNTTLENDVNGRDDDYHELTWIGDVEFGYQFANKLHIYSGLLYEYYDREASATSTTVHDGIGFMRYGAEYPVSQTLTLGAKIEHDISDEDNDYITGAINVRLVF